MIQPVLHFAFIASLVTFAWASPEGRGTNIARQPADTASEDYERSILEPYSREARHSAVFIGVSPVAHDTVPSLPYAVDDAIELAHILVVETNIIRPDAAVLILGGNPISTRSSKQLAELAKLGVRKAAASGGALRFEVDRLTNRSSRPQDCVLVFISAPAMEVTGRKGPVQGVLAAQAPKNLAEETVAWSEIRDLLSRSASRSQLLLLDFHSAGATRKANVRNVLAIESLLGSEAVWGKTADRQDLSKLIISDVVRQTTDVAQAIVVASNSRPDTQVVNGHGAYAASIIAVLRGSENMPTNGKVTCGQLFGGGSETIWWGGDTMREIPFAIDPHARNAIHLKTIAQKLPTRLELAKRVLEGSLKSRRRGHVIQPLDQRWVDLFQDFASGKLAAKEAEQKLVAWEEPYAIQGFRHPNSTSLTVSIDGKWAATWGANTDLHIWDLMTAQLSTRIARGAREVEMLAFSGDNRFLVGVTKTGSKKSATVWGVQTKGVVLEFPLPPADNIVAALAPNASIVAIARRDSASTFTFVSLWQLDFNDLKAPMEVYGPRLPERFECTGLALSGNGVLMITGYLNAKSSVEWYTLRSRTSSGRKDLSVAGKVELASISLDGQHAVTVGGQLPTLIRWQSNSGNWKEDGKVAIGAKAKQVTISSNGARAFYSQPAGVRFWTFSSRRHGQFNDHQSAVGGITILPDSPCALSLDVSGQVYKWYYIAPVPFAGPE
jgi:hypothetical protein